MSGIGDLQGAIEALNEKVDPEFKSCLEMLASKYSDFVLHFGVFPTMERALEFLSNLSFVTVEGLKIQSPSTMKVIVIKYADAARIVIGGQLSADQNHEILLKRKGLPEKVHTLCIADQGTLTFQAFWEASERIR